MSCFAFSEEQWSAAWDQPLTDRPQVFASLPREAYDQLPGWNASVLKTIIDKTLAHAWAAFFDPNRKQQKDQDQFLIGNLFHCMVLEPELFEKRYITLPADAPKRPTAKQLEGPKPRKDGTYNTETKTYTDWQDAVSRGEWWKRFEIDHPHCADAQVVSNSDVELAAALANAVLLHPVLGARFTNTPENRAGNELTLTWIDVETGARCKARLDSLRCLSEALWIGDLKSAMDAGPGPDAFGRSAASYLYCLSAAWYSDATFYCREALERLFGLDEGKLIGVGRQFEFIAVEKAHPRSDFIGRYMLSADQAVMGRKLARRALREAVQAEQSGWWPGYDSALQPLELPGYAYQRMMRLAGEDE